MDVTGVAAMADRPVDELSGGELQRVWLATCLAQDTPVLLLDEPTTFLDLRYQVEILDLVRDLADDHGVAVGVVLHDLNQAAAVADEVVLLQQGRVRATGTPATVFTEDALTETYGIRIEVTTDPRQRTGHHPPGRAAPRSAPWSEHPHPQQRKTAMTRTRFTALIAVVAALTLGACGTTENAAAPDTSASAAGGPVTVTDSRGKEITLKAPATKVVGLEWGEVEMLVSLGVMPVGVADPKGYGTWVTSAKLDPGVKDVGTRGEPSVDSIVALQPDLVVMEDDRGANIVSQLEKFVPVVVAKGSDATDNLGRMRTDLNMIAKAVGKTTEAEKLLDRLRRRHRRRQEEDRRRRAPPATVRHRRRLEGGQHRQHPDVRHGRAGLPARHPARPHQRLDRQGR